MIGRAAYHRPEFMSELDTMMYGQPTLDQHEVLASYRRYMAEELARGQRLHSMTRHVLGACNGMRGARRYRQTLSDARRLKANDINLFDEALAHVYQPMAETA